MLRARQTAAAVVNAHAKITKRHLPLSAVITPGLNEVKTPSDGLPLAHISKIGWHTLYTTGKAANEEKADDPTHDKFEEFPDVLSRVRDTIMAVREKHESGHVVLVSHGDCLLSARMIAAGLPATLESRMEHREKLCLPTASIVSLRVEHDGDIIEERVWSPSV